MEKKTRKMKKRTRMTFLKNKKMVLFIKLMFCLSICVLIGRNILLDGIDPYYSVKDYNTSNLIDENLERLAITGTPLRQTFYAKGNILTRINLYYSGEPRLHDTFSIQISNKHGVIWRNNYNFSEYKSDTWNEIEVNVSGLKRNHLYEIEFNPGNTPLTMFTTLYDQDDLSIYGKCISNGAEINGYASIGLNFVYRYLTTANVMFFVIRSLIIAFITLILCMGILRVETLYVSWHNAEKKYGFTFALYFTLYLIFLFNPMDKIRTKVITFTREIGAGLVANYDASRVINNFFNWFIIFVILFISFYLIANYFIGQKRNPECDKVYEFIEKIVVLSDVNLFLRAITFFYDESQQDSIFYYSSYLLSVIIIISILYIWLRLDRYVSAEGFYQLILGVFSAAFPIAIIIQKEWESGKLLFGVQVFLAFAAIVAVLVLRGYIRKIEEKKILTIAMITTSMFPFFTSLYIELINVLNQYGIFVASLGICYGIGCGLIVICGIIFGVVIYKGKYKLLWSKTWTHVWLIIGIVCLNQQILLENTYAPDIFESANYSVLINGFLKFGKIPIVESLGHHMMQGVWEGLFYAFVNGDPKGAIVSPYSGYVAVPLAVLFYLFIKEIWDKDMALWITLLFPFADYWNSFGWGILIALAAVRFVKKNTYFRATLLWLACVWCCLCRVDIGFSFALACITALIIYIIRDKNWKAIRLLLIPLVIIIFLGICLWCILCIIRDINPIARLIEFLKLFAASINWTPNSIGDNRKMVYGWGYLCIPFCTLICLCYIIFSRELHKNIGYSKWVLLLILGIAYITNFSRPLSRHSLLEMLMPIVFWTSYVFLSLFVSCIVNKSSVFLPAFTFFVLCETLFTSGDIFKVQPIADSAIERVGSFTKGWTLDRFEIEGTKGAKTYWMDIKENAEKKTRVTYTKEFNEKIEPFGFIMDLLLDEDETFLDFIYNSYVYSEYDRKLPVYVAQSPTMLSGELTQKYFIEEIEKNQDKIPIAFMPNNTGSYSSMDGINLSYKYYKVSEFIYKNYRPLCSYGYFSVWCLKERYDEMLEKIQTKQITDQIDLNDLQTYHCRISEQKGLITIISTGDDPQIWDLIENMKLSVFNDMTISIDIDYISDTSGFMKLYYKKRNEGTFFEDKSKEEYITNSGTAHFIIPYTRDTQIRLDIPDDSKVAITNIRVRWLGVGESKIQSLMENDTYQIKSCNVVKKNGEMTLVTTGVDPLLEDVQSALHISEYAGLKVNIMVDYKTDTTGDMQIFYTMDAGETYSIKKCVTQRISEEGTATFMIPITQYTKIRLDIPEGSTVTIKDIKLSAPKNAWSLIGWGYDPALHNHTLNWLPLFWAELDKYDAIDNDVWATGIRDENGNYVFDKTLISDKGNGNYLALSATYSGYDRGLLTKEDDESTDAILIVGDYDGEEFVEKCRYSFTIKEGEHDYLFRVSSDYYWMLDEIGTAKIECSEIEKLTGISIKILQGD